MTGPLWIMVLILVVSTDPLRVSAYSTAVYETEEKCLSEAARVRPGQFRFRDRVVEGVEPRCLPFDPQTIVEPGRASTSSTRPAGRAG